MKHDLAHSMHLATTRKQRAFGIATGNVLVYQLIQFEQCLRDHFNYRTVSNVYKNVRTLKDKQFSL